MIWRILRILGRVLTFTMLAVASFGFWIVALSEPGQHANLVGGVAGCVFWLAIIFDRRLTRKKEETRLPQEPSSLPQPAGG